MEGRNIEIERHGNLMIDGQDRADTRLLQQIQQTLTDSKKALIESIVFDQRQGFQTLLPRDVVKEKLITVLVDYPKRKERTLTYRQKTLFEREYVRQTRLMYETQLPKYVEELSRKTVLKGVNGINDQAPSNGQTHIVPTPSPVQAPNPGPSQNGAMAVSHGMSKNLQRGAEEPPAATALEARFQGDNPFRDFVQPSQTQKSHSPATSSAASHDQALTAAEGNQGKKKPRFGLKWFFSQPFKTGNETKPELEDITSPQSIEPDEDSPPVLEPANFGKPKSPVPELLDAGSTRDTTEPPLAPASTSHTNINAPKIGQSAARPEAVQRAIEAGDDDETRQVFYTQIEEEIVTKERTETYIEHQYFLREYVIRVNYLGEQPLGHQIEILSRNQYIMEGSRRVRQVTPREVSEFTRA